MIVVLKSPFSVSPVNLGVLGAKVWKAHCNLFGGRVTPSEHYSQAKSSIDI